MYEFKSKVCVVFIRAVRIHSNHRQSRVKHSSHKHRVQVSSDDVPENVSDDSLITGGISTKVVVVDVARGTVPADTVGCSWSKKSHGPSQNRGLNCLGNVCLQPGAVR